MSNLPNFTKPQVGADKPEDQPIPADTATQSVDALATAAPVEAGTPSDELSTVDWLRKELEKTRKEAAQRRIEAKEARDRVAAIERAKLEEQGQYQRLYEQTKAELEAKQIEIENQNVYKTAFEDMLRKRIETIPEAMRALVPTDYDPIRLSQWLDANWERLGTRKAPNLDAGQGGTYNSASGNAKAADPVAVELAKKLGISPSKLT